MTASIEFHPLANIFPLLEGEEFDALVTDIRQHGLNEDLWIYEGQILDGRNRYRACLKAGYELDDGYGGDFKQFTGDHAAALDFVISANLHRRHLSTSQRAMIGAQLAALKNGQRADLVQAPSIEEAAQLLNIGHASIERAKVVLGEGSPELIEAVQTGEMSVSGAVESIRRGNFTGNAQGPHAERGLDCYETPESVTRALLKVDRIHSPVWEPACGPGAIVRVLREEGHRVVATDLIDYGCQDATGGVDFLQQQSAPEGVTTILTNPPFMHADEFVRHGLTLAPRVIMLLRLGFLQAESRSDILEGSKLARVYVFRDRVPKMHRLDYDGPRNESNGMQVCWYVWDADHRGPPTLHWITCGKAAAPVLNGVEDGIPHSQATVIETKPDDGLDIPAFLRRVAS